MKVKAGDDYWIGAYILGGRSRYSGGYGAENLPLVTANAPDPERRSALEAAGFKVVCANTPQRTARRSRSARCRPLECSASAESWRHRGVIQLGLDELPAALVHHPVVSMTQQHEIWKFAWPAPRPMLDVMR